MLEVRRAGGRAGARARSAAPSAELTSRAPPPTPPRAATQGRIRGARSDRQTRERAQRDVLRSMEREVHEQQMASIEQLRAQLAAIDGIDDDYDVGKGEEFMHRLYNAAHNLRARGRRPRHSSGV